MDWERIGSGMGVALVQSLSGTCHLLVQQYWLKELFYTKHSPEIPISALFFQLLPVEVITFPGGSHPVFSDSGGMKVVVLLTLKQGLSMIYVKKKFYFQSYSSSVTGPDHTAPPKSVFRLTAM